MLLTPRPRVPRQVEITGFRIRANGWNTAPKNFYFQVRALSKERPCL